RTKSPIETPIARVSRQRKVLVCSAGFGGGAGRYAFPVRLERQRKSGVCASEEIGDYLTSGTERLIEGSIRIVAGQDEISGLDKCGGCAPAREYFPIWLDEHVKKAIESCKIGSEYSSVSE